ncbi:MAG: Sec-independent protein translocase protein TatB [Immundisolibacterales bacterium]|nr:Sec-independent protein translocase protein TatB [Immundisolibacterales bacterium]
MFEVGFLELALLGVVALLVVGPSRLPGLVRTVGVWVGRAQRIVGQVRADIEREVRAEELRKAAKEYSPTNVLSDVRKEVEDFAGDVAKPVESDAGKPGPEKPESLKSGSGESGSEVPAGTADAPPASAVETDSGAGSEPPGLAAGNAPEPGTGESEPVEPSAPGGPDSRAVANAPNGSEAPVDIASAEEAAGPGASAAVSEPPAGTVTPAGAARPNGRADDAAAAAMIESAEAPPAEQDERTAAP